MAYNIQKLMPYIQKYETILSTTNLEVSVRTMMSGIVANSKFALDGEVKSLIYIGGKSKARSPLRDRSVTEITTPQAFNDEDIYIESIIDLVNRYLSSIKIANSRNKVIAILVKLLSNNVTRFYDKFRLPPEYQVKMNCIFSNLLKASEVCLNNFQEAIEGGEYLMSKLPNRPEYGKVTAPIVYKTYLEGFNCETESVDSSIINQFMKDISEIEDDDEATSESIEIEETQDLSDLTQKELIALIPQIISNFGYAKVLSMRTDKFIVSKFGRIQDARLKKRLHTIISGFHTMYIRLTSKVFTDTYRSMFEMSSTTYKENKSKVIREIAEISNSEEFAQFKRLLLE